MLDWLAGVVLGVVLMLAVEVVSAWRGRTGGDDAWWTG